MMKKISNKLMRLMCLSRFTRFLGIKYVSIFRNRKSKLTSAKNTLNLLPKDNSILQELERSGFSSSFKIQDDLIDDIVSYASQTTFVEQNGNKKFHIDYSNPIKPSDSIWYGNYNLLKENESLQKIVYNKEILDVCKKYFGVNPKLISSHMWWSFPPDNDEYTHQYGFHYDIDSFKFLKIFIYLNDVDLNTGPHVIIGGTHKRKSFKEKLNRRLTDAQVQNNKRYSDVNIMIGEKGTCFFEDTFCYHKGQSPKKPRLILQAEYSI